MMQCYNKNVTLKSSAEAVKSHYAYGTISVVSYLIILVHYLAAKSTSELNQKEGVTFVSHFRSRYEQQ